MRGKRFARVLRFVAFAAMAAAGASAVVMTLWNWVMPVTFGLPVITFWRALGLLALSRLLLGGFHGGMGRRMHWRHRMREQWDQMTPDQRARFMEGMRHRCGRVEPDATQSHAL